eukprot:3629422-Karenia_brevis.AAC.1
MAMTFGWKVDSIDILHGFDLSDTDLVSELKHNLIKGKYAWIHMGPPCTAFSTWYRLTSKKNTRTKTCPQVEFANLCLQHDVWFSIENPRRSYMWLLSEFKQLAESEYVHVCNVVYCKFGMPWLKQTSFWTNAEWLMELACKCDCVNRH